MHRGQVLEKAAILGAVWPGTVVEENNLTQHISKLRQVLGETRGENRYIATVPGKGYCFTAELRERDRDEMPGKTQPSQHIGIGVLPFVNLSRDAERNYLTDGLTEESIATLGQIDPEHFSVIGRTTMMAYRETKRTLTEIGRELKAAYPIEGSLRTEGEHLRITTRLIRARDQALMWSATYDGKPRSMLALQRELADALAEQVHLSLSPVRLGALGNRHTQNAEAYDLYLRGRFFWDQFTPLTTPKAIEYFTSATALDPDYALAWSGVADALCSSPVTGDVPAESLLERAKTAAAHAIRCDASLAESQTSFGFFSFWLGWDWVESEKAYRKALAQDGSYAFAHRMLGILLSHQCRHQETAAAILRAREVDPLNAMNRALSAQIAFAGRDPEAAIQFAREAIVIDPEFWIGHF
ncbi:TolB-like protein [Granulicella aggregans]|uniref:TolB-like protein n=1 Tax=Granulicella aggregans TaxID=474949 RepID=A0A7W7ZHV5_9BACT|nr:TolB-like protein [Granulicella aggregans]